LLLILAVLAVQLILGRAEPVFPHFIMTRRLPTCFARWRPPRRRAAWWTRAFSSFDHLVGTGEH